MRVFLRSGRWRTSAFMTVVCLLMATCGGERRSTEPAEWATGDVRVTEPILSGFGIWHPCESRLPSQNAIVEQSVCAPQTTPSDPVSIECDQPMRTLEETVRLLAYAPPCTDAAIEKLDAMANTRRDAEVLSNLSAAYYIRAQRKDQPSDFVRALNSAEAAVAMAPASLPARFNRALAEEALGFNDDAVRSWNHLRRGTPIGWANEAAHRWSRLTRERTISAATQWRLNEERLPEVSRAGDRRAVETLIAPYRAAAQRFVEEQVLMAWAAAKEKGDEATAEEQLQLAEMIASALAKLTREHYLRDVVEGVRRSDPATMTAFRRGLAAFAEGRQHARTLHNEEATAAAYARAAQALGEARNPLRLKAMIRRAAALAVGGRFVDAQQVLATVQATAERNGYLSILGFAHAGRGYGAMLQSRFVDSVSEYTDSENAFRQIGDVENLCNILTRKVGVYRLIGNDQLTWREIFKASEYASAILEPQSRHIFLGEIALAALDLGYPGVALRYQNTAVALLQDELVRQADDERAVAQLLGNLGIAFRARAAIHAHLGDERSAQRDLEEALGRLDGGIGETDAAILNGFRARVAEAEAQTLAAKDRGKAIAALSRGIAYASRTHFRSLTASLLVQRADLHRLDANRTAEVSDLRAALRALAEEEQAMLSGPRRESVVEQMWSSFFARYQDTYRHLIQRLVEDGQDAEAFQYAERARAYEPLSLILDQPDVPFDFRARIRSGETFGLEDVRLTLPEETFLLQYAVLDDRTYVWVIWNGDFHREMLPVGNAEIERWTSTLQRLGSSGDVEAFREALAAPYAALLRKPLARIAKVKAAGSIPRVVIVPDRSMHGLPFAALREDDRHVVQDYRISVAASATLHAFSLAKDRQRRKSGTESMLIVADPAFDERLDVARGLGRLHWARAEAGRIETVYEDTVDVESLLDHRATSAEFLRLATTSSIIHVAAHGVANADIPSRSFLLFAPSGSDSGTVDAERLLGELRLERARLVVLAACSSAGGMPVGPEGLAPLVRPLLVAGVPGIIGTLWNVRESSETSELLVRFHHHYRNGRDAGDALRLAQLEMLGDPDLARSSAVVWAPFQATGYASSPFAQHTRR